MLNSDSKFTGVGIKVVERKETPDEYANRVASQVRKIEYIKSKDNTLEQRLYLERIKEEIYKLYGLGHSIPEENYMGRSRI